MDVILQRVPFVRAKEEDGEFSRVKEKRLKPESSESAGREAKDFYESLVGTSEEQREAWNSGVSEGQRESALKGPTNSSKTHTAQNSSSAKTVEKHSITHSAEKCADTVGAQSVEKSTRKRRRKSSACATADGSAQTTLKAGGSSLQREAQAQNVRTNKTTSGSTFAQTTFTGTNSRLRIKPGCSQTMQVYESEAHSIRTRAEVDLNARLRKGTADFLKCAQEGDLKMLKLHLQRGVDINAQDAYGWTAVMCSAHEGHAEALQFLLENSANVYIVDNQGKNALSIAESAKPKNKTMVQMLRDFMDGKQNWQALKKEDTPKLETFYCDDCKREFSDITEQKHETSTIHLFNSKSKQDRSTFYHLPESNKGFELLVRSGWDREQGLGPEGRGHKFPVKTVLKRDRLGLGNPPESGGGSAGRARVTHFAPNDPEAVKRVKVWKDSNKERNLRKTTLSKRKQAKVLSKEKQKEMDFRIAFNTDF